MKCFIFYRNYALIFLDLLINTKLSKNNPINNPINLLKCNQTINFIFYFFGKESDGLLLKWKYGRKNVW